jgi:hypothetical protein
MGVAAVFSLLHEAYCSIIFRRHTATVACWPIALKSAVHFKLFFFCPRGPPAHCCCVGSRCCLAPCETFGRMSRPRAEFVERLQLRISPKRTWESTLDCRFAVRPLNEFISHAASCFRGPFVQVEVRCRGKRQKQASERRLVVDHRRAHRLGYKQLIENSKLANRLFADGVVGSCGIYRPGPVAAVK